jgi:hypothetical protein
MSADREILADLIKRIDARLEGRGDSSVMWSSLRKELADILEGAPIEQSHRPAPVEQTQPPAMEVGKFYAGVGWFTGYGTAAKAFETKREEEGE